MKQKHKFFKYSRLSGCKYSIGIIGCGNMGQALVKGIKSKYPKADVCAYDIDKRRLKKVAKSCNAAEARSLKELVKLSSTLVIAVKPQDIEPALRAIKDNCLGKFIISIAAGVSTSYIQKKVHFRMPVVRAMPNLAAKVGGSVTALAAGKYGLTFISKAIKIFDTIGISMIMDEKYMDAVTAISGSGPGYVYYFMDCIYQSALSLGLSKQIARKLVAQTFLGASNLVKDSNDDFKVWASRVASKGGTTEAALNIFKKQALKSTVKQAVRAAYLRAKKLKAK
ncbi:MAG: pyrroline-5-carboxylate reductase [Candidatus Omnitrophica bacterium]|nr:pyrroline-5-carboxylate reductase [Candidatus Omnitrophota bacterium]